MKKWEYEIYVSKWGAEEFDKKLKQLGQLGWELVTVTVETDQFDVAYFKREIKSRNKK